MAIFAWLHTLLLMAVITGATGFHPLRPFGHHERSAHHEGHKAKVVAAAHDDDYGRVKVRTRHGHTHVKLGSHRHGVEVWTDDKGGSKVRLGDLAVDTD